MIRVQNLSKSFGPKLAVNGVSFTVDRGEVLGFLGPNGAGKSTTMRMILGLDVEGIRWIRALLHDLAAQGKTVFVSSHLMSEIAQTATHLIVIGRGRLIADTSVAEFIAAAAPPAVRVRSSDQHGLAALLRSPGVTVAPADDGALAVSGMHAEQIGAAAATAGITVLELATEQTSLEDAFVDMTQGAVEFRAAAQPAAGPTFEEEK